MMSRNLDIHFFKFIYAGVIVLYHLASNSAITCPGGYCAVEYFLLAAGVFLFASFERGEQTGRLATPAQYLVKRFLRFLPWSLTAFLLTAFVQRILIDKTFSPIAWLDYFSGDIWEILMISANGMNNNVYFLNSPAWTLSAMLLVGFLIWTLLYHYKKAFFAVILPLSLIVGYGYWMHLPSANTELWIGFTTFGTFRTWLVMCLSYFCLPLGRKLASVPLNKTGKLLLTIAEVLTHLFALAVIFCRAERYYQWLLTALFMLSISIALSGHSYIAKAFENRRSIQLLGDLSMSLYLVHTAVLLAFRYVFDMDTWSYFQLIPLFLVVIVAAVCHYYGTSFVVRLVSNLWQRFCRKITA